MKVHIKRLAIALIAINLLTIFPIATAAQNGNPPPPPNSHGEDTNQPPGGGAPIGSGIGILLALGAAYGGKKLRNIRKNKSAE